MMIFNEKLIILTWRMISINNDNNKEYERWRAL